ncbi:selenoprotein t, putative [Ichthyophthirius multifiliis]|uniref:Selenoprotein t, putative n=1 Tax=Ichthyophthirius multifiliis TaxID=5932 RepID=G0QNF5_ICHMU|nr:selenoprotein t, putative [Ichthyophthirius multifiliis]EGR33244.1 selenoprotein t, putative [Ichthyophthirius multifiliis]|eukprot:XP_004037230.1 selenoprotein t, putative [Ichthyophthirius multifiliis]
MSKQTVEKFVFQLFIVLLIFDVSTNVFLAKTPIQKEPKETPQNPQNEEQPEQFENVKNTTDNDEENFQKFKNQRSTLNLQIQYCKSHQKTFDEIQNYIKTEYPSIFLEGFEYPLSPIQNLLSKFVNNIHWIVLVFNLFGDRIFGMLNMNYPKWYLLMKNHKMQTVIGVIMVTQLLGSIVGKSDAFEIYVDGNNVYSKLNTGILPTLNAIDDIVQRNNV